MQINTKLTPCDYQGVTLTSGIAKQQFEDIVDYFLRLPNDDILLGFRRRAGLPHPGEELGGWYSNDGSFNIYDWDEIFNPFGQWLGFLAKAYRVTGDQRLLEKAAYLMKEWGKTIEADGYFFYSEQCNGLQYAYEKMAGGLTDLYLYAGLKEAKDLLEIITDWAQAHLPKYRCSANGTRSGFTGGNTAIHGIDNEWYTLPENLYRMYLASGGERYKSFAGEWHYDYYWDALQYGNPEVMTGVHGYSHVNTLNSAAYAYLVTGKEKYLTTILKGYDLFQRHQRMGSGGFAFDEHLADPWGSNYYDVEQIAKSFEVPCGSWAVFKLTRHLLSITGEAKYGDWAETILYNGMFAALPMKDDAQRRGKTFYYADYRIGGGRKVYYEHSFPCCSGTYPQAVTEYHNLIYYLGEDGIYLSQYLPSILETEWRGERLSLEICGNYPTEDQFSIQVKTDGTYRLSLRVPSWLREGEGNILVNGEDSGICLKAGEWAKLNRQWKTGDQIAVTFPMHLRLSPITPSHQERAALMYGPMMLAAAGRRRTILGSPTHPEEIAGRETGTFRFTAQTPDGIPVTFLPFWTFQEKEWYTVYLDFLS